DLNVEAVSSDACPIQPDLDPFDDEVSGVLVAGDPSVLTGSCVPAQQLVLPGGLYPLPEHSYPVTVAGAICNVTIIADAPVAVYVREGLECGGRELFCEAVDEPEEGAFIEGTLGRIGADALSYVVSVEATNPNGPDVNYTLGFACALP
ncbi:MAG TPA: hypothetical protein VMG12_45935, partial [Polyangiaceae bacterium]|nr:hypothetical protein [Polyangiaceae bacterium]